MRKIDRAKVVLIIVEGAYDKISLGIHLDRLNRGNNIVKYEIIGSDITTVEHVESNNIREEIYKIVKNNNKMKFHVSDFKEIIHLVDTDGAYIDDSDVIQNDTITKIRYSNNKIYTRNRQYIIARNKKKRDNLNILINTDVIGGGIPYRVFYVSSNLEHVLHDKTNLEDSFKRKLAQDFELMFQEDDNGFSDFICNSDFSVKLNYPESWEFIKLNNRSLQRFTNLDILISELTNQNNT